LDQTHTLIIGAGISGLSFANFTANPDYLIVEAQPEVGGYCRTVRRDGFVWDYSGHFFHFRHPEIERYLVERMPPGKVRRIAKCAKILFGRSLIDFPFQKNIHQLPKEDFIDCLYDLFFREEKEAQTFKEMLYSKFGRGIAERFLIPYNEKLYATDLATLDTDAMGRFFPHADLPEIVRNFRNPDNSSYNATFTYPRGGAIEYILALCREVPDERVSLGESVLRIDLDRRVALTDRREIRYERVVSSAPFNRLLAMAAFPHDPTLFTSNKVLVFNLGFDRKSWDRIHWVYFPERKYSFYRVGFYDNIFETDRMSLYVEIGLSTSSPVHVERSLERVLEDLAEAGIVEGHELVAWHSVVLDPAYVHITRAAQRESARILATLAESGVHSIGRYGGWKYCAIEDNIVEARALVERLEGRKVEL
jgi:protoporphyrinogen oxidase